MCKCLDALLNLTCFTSTSACNKVKPTLFSCVCGAFREDCEQGKDRLPHLYLLMVHVNFVLALNPQLFSSCDSSKYLLYYMYHFQFVYLSLVVFFFVCVCVCVSGSSLIRAPKPYIPWAYLPDSCQQGYTVHNDFTGKKIPLHDISSS